MAPRPTKLPYSAPVKTIDSVGGWYRVVDDAPLQRATLTGPLVLALFTAGLGLGGFSLWATVTNVAQAAVASAKVIVESNTKTVTHLEGGTLKAVEVREGQRVKAGQVLALLDVTRSNAAVRQSRWALFVAKVKLARLIAERDEQTRFTLVAQAILPDLDPEMAQQVISTEEKLFGERVKQLRDQIAADQTLIDQLRSQEVALRARLKYSKEQEQVLAQNVDMQQKLQKKKLTTLADFVDVKIRWVDVQMKVAETDASIAEIRQKTAQSELQLTNRRTEYFRSVSEQIQEAQASVRQIEEQIISSTDVVAKSEIRSPQDGIVANVKIRAPGSAVIGGQPILDIVPDNQPMLLEAQAQARDIDTIRLGEEAEIRLSAFGASEAFPLKGKVIFIAPDALVNEKSGETTYLLRIEINKSELAKQPNLFLYPGMNAEVHIVSGSRSVFAYLVEPLRRSFARAFREQ